MLSRVEHEKVRQTGSGWITSISWFHNLHEVSLSPKQRF